LTPARTDPVFFLAGGPGVAATEHWLASASMFPDLNRDRDFVLVDQRGTGGSNRVLYPPIPDLSTLSPAEAARGMETWMAQALASTDADPRQYTTAVAMDDLDDVRAALGYDRINVYGNSYGATAAQVYLRRHGRRVRTLVLDGGSLLDVPLMEAWAPNAQRTLDKVFSLCEADPACHGAFPSVREEFAELLRMVRRRPIPIVHPVSRTTIWLTPRLVQETTQMALQDVTRWSGIPLEVNRYFLLAKSLVAHGDEHGAAPAESYRPIHMMMSLAVICSEFWAKMDSREVTRHSEGTWFAEWAQEAARRQEAVCRVVPRGIVDPRDGRRVGSNVPVLILNGEWDPQDPPGNVANANAELPNSLSVFVPNAAHTVVQLGCLRNVMTDFIRRGSTIGVQTGCARDLRPPIFKLNR
jgi:pimeloyl-ACP methyl ester carboxylesterase